jgi:hypothetical protein
VVIAYDLTQKGRVISLAIERTGKFRHGALLLPWLRGEYGVVALPQQIKRMTE